jgi:hypothetical protein
VQEHTTQLDDLQLIAAPSAVSCAALFVQFTLTEWKLSSAVTETTEVAQLLVTAIVNVVDEDANPAGITVRLRLRGPALTVEVEADPTVPDVPAPDGLPGDSHGVARMSNGRQLLWCEMPLPDGLHAKSVALPRRGTTKHGRVERTDARPEPESAEVDIDIMQRILSSLNR